MCNVEKPRFSIPQATKKLAGWDLGMGLLWYLYVGQSTATFPIWASASEPHTSATLCLRVRCNMMYEDFKP